MKKSATMSVAPIPEVNRQLLLQSVRMCQAVGPYIKTLNLNDKEVTVFKNDVEAVLYITEHYKSFANSFFLYHLCDMRKSLEALVNACRKSANYTENIGKVLGIEERSFFTTRTFNETSFYTNSQN